MFYQMINKQRDIWYAKDCPIADIISYIEKTNQMRDAQIDAIKTYLYLKIACENKPLYELFISGKFNTLNLDDLPISTAVREALGNDPALAALYEYCYQEVDGKHISEKGIKAIQDNPNAVNAKEFFKNAFYGVTYTDYLFSLPMGAGKTYLMAAFIYLDLYFAMNEPDNKAFAHNFIIFAPSGLKSSVVPSLKTIQKFNPSWIIAEPVASELKRKLIFEILDENKTAKKSNKTKNPNAQKIANHQPFNDLFGLVAVTNAEKVILDRIEEKNGQISFFDESEDIKDKQANKLRNLIGKVSHLSVFIDEVHHAATDEKKLRAVVNKWATNGNINSVIGFSGTPYLQKAESVYITSDYGIKTEEISNIVYYYRLVDGIGNFLKKPTVYTSSSHNRAEIIESGVRQFLNDFKDKVYADGTCAKLGIYCGNIETLEEQVFPLVERIVAEYGFNASEVVLKYHGGNKNYPIPADSGYEFATLDKAISKKKIILLVQIGKEGWDCRSLTGIILSQEGDCSTNMVLQTSCRCLRQVEKGKVESALIYLNESNAKTLNLQLQQQHRINLDDFQKGSSVQTVTLKRYDRTQYLKLPKVEFYQLKINYKTITEQPAENIGEKILSVADSAEIKNIKETSEITTELHRTGVDIDSAEYGNTIASFNVWVNEIIKESFGFICYKDISPYFSQLKEVFNQITHEKNGLRYFSSQYRQNIVRENIRKAFYDKRTFNTVEELIPDEANLLHVENLTAEVKTSTPEIYTPIAETVEKIISDDKGKLALSKKQLADIKKFEEMGYNDFAETIRKQVVSHPMKNSSFHYLPYKTDSDFEVKFLEELLTVDVIKNLNLEVYYNGDKALTEFKIKCYKSANGKLQYVGMYTPDFLILQRKDEKIFKAIIVETKGKIYANDPTFIDKRNFTANEFVLKNNEIFGYDKFTYLYLEDTIPENNRIIKTIEKVKEFFTESVK